MSKETARRENHVGRRYAALALGITGVVAAEEYARHHRNQAGRVYEGVLIHDGFSPESRKFINQVAAKILINAKKDEKSGAFVGGLTRQGLLCDLTTNGILPKSRVQWIVGTLKDQELIETIKVKTESGQHETYYVPTERLEGVASLPDEFFELNAALQAEAVISQASEN
jgi:hypothetical protein